MPTTDELTWGDLAPAERARVRLEHADALDCCRRADECSFDPVQAAAYERREAASDLAEVQTLGITLHQPFKTHGAPVGCDHVAAVG